MGSDAEVEEDKAKRGGEAAPEAGGGAQPDVADNEKSYFLEVVKRAKERNKRNVFVKKTTPTKAFQIRVHAMHPRSPSLSSLS